MQYDVLLARSPLLWQIWLGAFTYLQDGAASTGCAIVSMSGIQAASLAQRPTVQSSGWWSTGEGPRGGRPPNAPSGISIPTSLRSWLPKVRDTLSCLVSDVEQRW